MECDFVMNNVGTDEEQLVMPCKNNYKDLHDEMDNEQNIMDFKNCKHTSLFHYKTAD